MWHSSNYIVANGSSCCFFNPDSRLVLSQHERLHVVSFETASWHTQTLMCDKLCVWWTSSKAKICCSTIRNKLITQGEKLETLAKLRVFVSNIWMNDPSCTSVAHKAKTWDFCCSLSLAVVSSSFHVFPVVFISASMVFQISCGRHLFLLPLCGFHLNAVCVMLSWSFLITCLSHLCLLCFIIVVMSLFAMFWGQYILHIFLRHEVWKPDSLELSLWVTFQHSAPCSSTGKMLLL